mmetsp:Transcript_88283/g.189545  ORF Transcript_88283/g.189545 Transcript_88283/m.189545 type:complete len:211 (-) Transcript_88283:85-717(-)
MKSVPPRHPSRRGAWAASGPRRAPARLLALLLAFSSPLPSGANLRHQEVGGGRLVGKPQEAATREEVLRARGAAALSPPPQEPVAAPAELVPAAASGRPSLVSVGVKASVDASAEHGDIIRPKGWDQCLNFARYVKGQGVQGGELVRVWKATCEPAVRSGRATERYRLMCNSLGGAVEPFAAQVDYSVEQVCDSVLTIFHDLTSADAHAR